MSECPRAWPLAKIDADVFAKMRKLPVAQAKRELAALPTRWATPQAIDDILDELPTATLALLGLLAESGGMQEQVEIDREARARFGMSHDDVGAALDAAHDRVLVIGLATNWGGRMVALVSPAADLIVARVRDLDVPRLATADFVADGDHQPRMLLAAATMLDHAAIKPTNDGRPNRTHLKRLATQAGVEVDTFDAWITTAIAIGLVGHEGDALRPRRAALDAAARGEYPGRPMIAAVAEQVAREPIAHTAVARLVSRAMRRHAGVDGVTDAGWYARLPGFALGTVDGIPALGRGDVGGTPTGHVTPSFEVFLPPESPAQDLVRLGAFAEVTRLDRVITMRVTRASVGRATATGWSADAMVAALAGLGRHPVPQNVEVAIRDWAGQSHHAELDAGQVIVVAAEAADRTATALAGFGARRLAAGVFLVDRDLPRRAIANALAKAGIQIRDRRPAEIEPNEDDVPPPRPPITLPRLGEPAPRLRARFAAWQRGETTGHAPDRVLREAAATNRDLEAIANGFERWAERTRQRWPADDPQRAALKMALSLVGPDGAGVLLDRARNATELAAAALALLEGLAATAAVPMPIEVLRQKLRPRDVGVADLATDVRIADLPRRFSARPDRSLEANLCLAAAAREPVCLQLRSGRQTLVLVLDVLPRGRAMMMLGEEVDSGIAVALRLDEIAAIVDSSVPTKVRSAPTKAPAVPATGDRAAALRSPWVPGLGQPTPPGHAPCPCGSGDRYRKCCRRVV